MIELTNTIKTRQDARNKAKSLTSELVSRLTAGVYHYTTNQELSR